MKLVFTCFLDKQIQSNSNEHMTGVKMGRIPKAEKERALISLSKSNEGRFFVLVCVYVYML